MDKRHARFSNLAKFLTIAVALSAQGGPLFAADATPTAAELVAVLRNAKVVNSEYPLRASLNEHEAMVVTKKAPDATDKDCKINAMLFARALVDAFPSEVARVKVLFSDYSSQIYSQVKVSKGDVKSYGSGALKENELLDSIEISTFHEDVSPFSTAPGSGPASLAVAPGVLQDKRLLLLSRIESMRQKGTNVKMFTDYFERIEDLVKQGDEAQVSGMVSSLSEKLNEQERMRQQVNQTNLQREVIEFQTNLNRFSLSGKPLPFDKNQLVRVQSLVVSGHFAEAKSLMQALQKKLH